MQDSFLLFLSVRAGPLFFLRSIIPRNRLKVTERDCLSSLSRLSRAANMVMTDAKKVIHA